jgi:hypothetical protein
MSRALRKEELPDRVIRKDAVLDFSGDPTIVRWTLPNTLSNVQLMTGQIEKMIIEQYGPDRGFEIHYAIMEGFMNCYKHRNEDNPMDLNIRLGLYPRAVIAKIQGEPHDPWIGYETPEERGSKIKDPMYEHKRGTIYMLQFADLFEKSLDGRVLRLGFKA